MENTNQEFDQYAKDYTTILDQTLAITGEDSNFYANYKAKKLASWLPELTTKKCTVLDFGCGVGLMASQIAPLFAQANIFGVDPSSKSIELAQQKFANHLMVFEVAGNKLHYPDNMFDMAYASNVFHHIPFADHAAYIKEIFRVLKPGGIFILIESNPLNPGTRYIFNRSPIELNSQMLYPWYAHRLLREYGRQTMKFYCFYPKPLGWLRFTEPALTKIPLGGFYACLVTKH